MKKKQWVDPEVNELGVENTEYGTKITTKVDASFQQTGYDFYSFNS
ncbi:MAG: hypothetical protein PHX70_13815 [Clostridium sp.]|nr:hypothetical protein [Clostridium sp.]